VTDVISVHKFISVYISSSGNTFADSCDEHNCFLQGLCLISDIPASKCSVFLAVLNVSQMVSSFLSGWFLARISCRLYNSLVCNDWSQISCSFCVQMEREIPHGATWLCVPMKRASLGQAPVCVCVCVCVCNQAMCRLL